MLSFSLHKKSRHEKEKGLEPKGPSSTLSTTAFSVHRTEPLDFFVVVFEVSLLFLFIFVNVQLAS